MFRPILLATALVLAATNAMNAQEIVLDDQYDNIIRIWGSDDTDVCTVRKLGGDRLRIRMESYDPAADDWTVATATFDIYPSPEFDNVVVMFSGKGGDDTFEVLDPEDFEDYDITFDLHGDEGLDDLQGGPGANFLVGGHDGEPDILRGSIGEDSFYEEYKVRTMIFKGPPDRSGRPTTVRYPFKDFDDEVILDFESADFDRVVELRVG